MMMKRKRILLNYTMISNRKTFCVFHLFHKYLIQYSSCTTRITCCKHREKKESSPNYFHKAVRWGCFLFSVYSILMIKYSFRRLHFLFSPCFSVCTSSTYARVSCRDWLFVVSGKGSSGLLRTKKVGAASRLDDNLHTSISLQVVFSP